MNKQKWYGVLRHILGAAGAILITVGASEDTINTFEVISGSVLGVLAILWSVGSK